MANAFAQVNVELGSLDEKCAPTDERTLAEAKPTKPSSAVWRLRSVARLPNHRILSELQQLNREHSRLEAELLVFLGELDARQLYREHAVSSSFEFCVARLGYSEDIAWKRVGAARLIRRFPRAYELLAVGRVHLTALMLIKPQLTEENHEDWLAMVCGKSKRQIERLVAARCPRPPVAASVRKLSGRCAVSSTATNPGATLNTGAIAGAVSSTATNPDATSNTGAITGAASSTEKEPNMVADPITAKTEVGSAEDLPGFGMRELGLSATVVLEGASGAMGSIATVRNADGVMSAAPAARVVPLSSSTYRVTFTASGQLKVKLDRARELLSHCIRPSDLPGLVERALDALIEREDKRRFGAPRSKQNHRSSTKATRNGAATSATDVRVGEAVGAAVGANAAQGNALGAAAGEEVDACSHRQFPGQNSAQTCVDAQDPDPLGADRGARRSPSESDLRLGAERRRRRSVPMAVRRAVFERDGGQCTYVDSRGRRCGERRYLEFDHIHPRAAGGDETERNLRLRCAQHNQLEAEKLFGRVRVKSATSRAKRRHERDGSAH